MKKAFEYMEPELIQATLFSELNDCEFDLYRQVFGCLRYPSRQWLALNILRYRRYGVMPKEMNRNFMMNDAFQTLVDAYDGMKEAELEKQTDAIEGRAKLSYPKRLWDWFSFT